MNTHWSIPSPSLRTPPSAPRELASRRHRLLAPIAAASLLASAVAAGGEQGGGPAAVEGQLGQVYPQSGDVRFGDALVHQDTEGGNNQTLFALAGAEGGGFAALWRDQRDGILGLYLVRLDAELALREPERPAHLPYASRRRDPGLALQPGGAGAAVWVTDVSGHPMAWVRAFDRRGEYATPDQPLVPFPAAGAARPARDAGLSQPAVAARKNGFLVAWTAGGKLQFATTGADGVPSDAELRPTTVRTAAPVSPGVVVASGPRESVCLFESGGSAWAFDPARPDAAPKKLGAGEVPLRAVADPRGGFWALSRAGDRLVLRHLSDDGKPEREELHPIEGAVAAADLAVTKGALALLVELAAAPEPAPAGRERAAAPARGRGAATRTDPRSAFRLQLLDPEGAPLRDAAIDFLPPETRAASGPRIASDGERLCVAWTEARERLDPDVYARTIDPAAPPERRLGAARRLNTDQSSADQIQARVAGAGERGLVVWQDLRGGRARTFVRRVGPAGFVGDELPVPAPFESGTASPPGADVPAAPAGAGTPGAPAGAGVPGAPAGASVPGAPAGASDPIGVEAEDTLGGGEAALRADGSHLVSWLQQRGTQRWLRAQAFSVDGRALAPPITIDELEAEAPAADAIAALPADHGWLVLFARGERGRLWTRRVTPSGALAGEPIALGEDIAATSANPAIAVLDDQRCIALWDIDPKRGEERRFVRGRFLDHAGAPQGAELGFEPSGRGVDWDPAVAPAGKNGFLVAWTSGTDPTRDVVARLYDSRGQEAGPLLPISVLANEQDFPDVARLEGGGFAVAWEDDISGFDHTLIRRIAADGRSLGPIVRINELPTSAVEDRVAPVVAPLGNGVIAAFGDRRRSKGWDVYLRVLGPRFDGAAKR